jgi:hypothetical protein
MFCCFFFKIFRLLICRVFFFAECFLTLGKDFAECPKKALGKEPFAECSLPSVTLAECKIAFAECLRHSAKNAIPVVTTTQNLQLTVSKQPSSGASMHPSLSLNSGRTQSHHKP